MRRPTNFQLAPLMMFPLHLTAIPSLPTTERLIHFIHNLGFIFWPS